MRNIITIVIIALAAFLGLVNAGLTDAGNLTTYNTPELQSNKDDDDPPIINPPEPRINCYLTGAHWTDLGEWQQIFDALQISGVMRVNDIPAGYHISDNIQVGPHCYVYEVGINKGHAHPAKVDYNNGLKMVYTCTRGGKQSVNWHSPSGEIVAKGWVKGDPQHNTDCAGG